MRRERLAPRAHLAVGAAKVRRHGARGFFGSHASTAGKEVATRTHVARIDVFEGRNAGLIVAEVELRHEKQSLQLPKWVGQEITSQARYSNANLALRPFCSW